MKLLLNERLCKGVFVFAFASLMAGSAIKSIADGGRPPCSGKTDKPCGAAVNASNGCVKLVSGCQGEVLEGPYTSDLTDGLPENNMEYTSFYRVCLYRFECIDGILSGCRRGQSTGASMVKEVKVGGDCQLPVPAQ